MLQNRSQIRALLIMILLGVGCATANRESSADEVAVEMVPTEAELSEQLTGGQPSAAQLRAFEVRAQQKLRDFADYLTIVADSTLDSAFRAEAQQQAAHLFVDRAQITLPLGSAAPETAELQDFLDLIRTDTAREFVVSKSSVSQALTPQADGRYTGELVFDGTPSSAPEGEQEGRAEVVLKKVSKQFGEEQEQVWEVFLGDIR